MLSPRLADSKLVVSCNQVQPPLSGLTRIYEHLDTKNYFPTIDMSTTHEPHGERPPLTANKRPSTLSELRQRVTHDLCDEREPFKSCLERAEQSKKEGRDYSNFDPERAFVAFARAGYLYW